MPASDKSSLSSPSADRPNDRDGMSRRDFLSTALKTSVGASLVGFGFMDDGYTKISETFCQTSGHLVSMSRMTKTLDGGYACCTQTLSDAGLIKLDASGHQQWARFWDGGRTDQRALSTLQTRDGSFYLLGYAESREQSLETWGLPSDSAPTNPAGYPMILKYDKDGTQQPYRIRSTLPDVGTSRVAFAIEDVAGLVFLGNKFARLPELPGFPLGYDKGISPWIFKVSHQGELLWEYVLQVDEARPVIDPWQVFTAITKPLHDAKGNLLVAVGVVDIRKGFGTESDKYEGAFGTPETQRLLVLKLSPDGRELARFRSTESGYGLLVRIGEDVHVISPGGTEKKPGVVHLTLDADLVQTSRVFYQDDDQLTPLAAVAATRSGTFHVLANSRPGGYERGDAVLLHLDGSGRFKHKKFFGKGTSPDDMVAGNAPNEIVVAYHDSPSHKGLLVARFRATE